jgi:Glyoxalase/Bleomycin resistance protein/Dioxygenase superfamily
MRIACSGTGWHWRTRIAVKIRRSLRLQSPTPRKQDNMQFMQGHYQNAYVTHDIDAAMEIMRRRFGIDRYIQFEPDMPFLTQAGPRQVHVKACLAWTGGLQIELIQPVDGYIDHYVPYLPTDRSDPTPRFHHIAVRRDDQSAMRQEIAQLGLPLAFEGEVPGLLFIYLDARESVGHYFEYVWATPQMWADTGWPNDRPVI